LLRAEAIVRAERVRDRSQRLAKVLGQHVLVRKVVRHLAQAVHVIGEAEQPGRNVGQALECLSHLSGPHHLAEGADVRQTGGTIAGLEQDITLVRSLAVQALEKIARLGEGPRPRRRRQLAFAGHDKMCRCAVITGCEGT